MQRRAITQFELFLIFLCLLGLVSSAATSGMTEPDQPDRVMFSAIATIQVRPTPTITVDWRRDVELASTELPQLQSVPAVSLRGVSTSSGCTIGHRPRSGNSVTNGE